MRVSIGKQTAAAILAAAVLVPALAEVPNYVEIQLQARSNIVDGYNLPANSSFNSKTPAINNQPTIAFTLIVVGGGSAGLFVGKNGIGSVVYSAPGDRLLQNPSINEIGEVAFDQGDVFSDGVFIYDSVGQMTSLVISPTEFDFTAAATVIDDGRIGYRAGQTGSFYDWRLFDHGDEEILVSMGGEIAYLFTPSTNNQGRIAGKVRLGHTGNDAKDQIRAYISPDVYFTLAEDVDSNAESPYSGFDNSVTLTDNGWVAFVAGLVGGGRGVLLTDGVSTRTIATTGAAGCSSRWPRPRRRRCRTGSPRGARCSRAGSTAPTS